jgi:hypothetical protein
VFITCGIDEVTAGSGAFIAAPWSSSGNKAGARRSGHAPAGISF